MSNVLKRLALALSMIAGIFGADMLYSEGYGQTVNTIGAGARESCGKWLDYRSRKIEDGMINWALGFISGSAVYGDVGNPLQSTDSEGVIYWLDNYCRTHASESFSAAVRSFITDPKR